MSLLCVTNKIRPGKHNVRGKHASGCDGWRGEEECKGCLPRKAQHGLLCMACWERVVDTMSAWPSFAETIAGLDRLVVHESAGVRSKAAGSIPIPQTWLDVDEAESFLHTYKQAGDNLDYWVSSEHGAMDAINFCVSAERAFRTHPLEEKAHRIKLTVCPECEAPSLVWQPASFFGDEVQVVCCSAECGHVMDQSTFELLAQVEGRKK